MSRSALAQARLHAASPRRLVHLVPFDPPRTYIAGALRHSPRSRDLGPGRRLNGFGRLALHRVGSLDQITEGAHHTGMKLRSGAATQLGQRVADTERSSVGTCRGHRVEGIADRDDARAERDGLTSQLVGITASVVALVARTNEVG